VVTGFRRHGALIFAFAFGPDAAAITFDDALGEGEAESGARVGVFVEALEESEDPGGVILMEADAIVSAVDDFGADRDARRGF
jgi:hypothetical protein